MDKGVKLWLGLLGILAVLILLWLLDWWDGKRGGWHKL